MNAIAQIAPQTSLAVASAETAPVLADSLLNFVARAMTDPAINVDKLEVLLRMQREIVAGDARLQFNRAMSKAQSEMQPVMRDARNEQTNSRYARLETIDAALRPVYTANGFCLSFDSVPVEGPNIRIVCEVSHTAGHAKSFHLEAGLDTAGLQGKANKTPLHGLGSSVSYLRRYLTCMIFHVVLANEDQDGNRAPAANSGRISAEQLGELNALMAATRTQEGKFLAAMCPQFRSISQAPASEFPRLKNALLSKKSVLAQRWRPAVQQEDAAQRTAAQGART